MVANAAAWKEWKSNRKDHLWIVTDLPANVIEGIDGKHTPESPGDKMLLEIARGIKKMLGEHFIYFESPK